MPRGQLLMNVIKIRLIGADEDVIGWNHLEHPVVCLLQKRASCAKEVYELFRRGFTTARPKAFTFSSGQNDTVLAI